LADIHYINSLHLNKMNILKIGIGVILVESVTAQWSAIETTASGNTATAMGSSTTASGDYSTAMGSSTTASGNTATAMGSSTTASGDFSTAMGYSTIASDYASVSIGQYNLAGKTATSTTVFSLDNTAFVIGNGVDSNTLSDAFKVMFNGDATVSNDLTVSGDATVSTDLEVTGSTSTGDLQVQNTLTIGNQVLTGAHVAQLLNLLTQLAGTDDDQKACLKTKWNTLSTC